MLFFQALAYTLLLEYFHYESNSCHESNALGLWRLLVGRIELLSEIFMFI